MLRRAFLRLTCAASVAALVSLEAFKAQAGAEIQPPDPLPERHEQTLYSPVLLALRAWNDRRLAPSAWWAKGDFKERPQRFTPRSGGFVKADLFSWIDRG